MSPVETSPDLEDTQPIRVVAIPPRRQLKPLRDGWASEPSPDDEPLDAASGLRRANEPSIA